jgi:biotin transport system substrate-specific component
MLAIAGSLLLTASAKFKVPMYPVPISMQTFVVLVIGMLYGWKLGGATVFLYLFQGAINLPVFAGTPEKGLGMAYMMGPTGGYLAGFLVAAMLVGWLAQKGWDRNILTTFFAMVLGNLIIYALGLYWLGTVLGWDKPILQYGLMPFIWGDLAKVILAMLIVPAVWKMIKR